MKKLYIILLSLVINISLFAQAPQSFNYQAIIRNNSGEVIKNQQVSLRISILLGGAEDTAVYTETHLDTTNQFGLVNIKIGDGTTTDDFSAIDWANNPTFVKIELDATGGSDYHKMGVSQLLSVPYALCSKNTENINDADADSTNEFQNLNLIGDTLSITKGNSITIPSMRSIWNSSGKNIYYNNGNVGIGTLTPSGKLEVKL